MPLPPVTVRAIATCSATEVCSAVAACYRSRHHHLQCHRGLQCRCRLLPFAPSPPAVPPRSAVPLPLVTVRAIATCSATEVCSAVAACYRSRHHHLQCHRGLQCRCRLLPFAPSLPAVPPRSAVPLPPCYRSCYSHEQSHRGKVLQCRCRPLPTPPPAASDSVTTRCLFDGPALVSTSADDHVPTSCRAWSPPPQVKPTRLRGGGPKDAVPLTSNAVVVSECIDASLFARDTAGMNPTVSAAIAAPFSAAAAVFASAAIVLPLPVHPLAPAPPPLTPSAPAPSGHCLRCQRRFRCLHQRQRCATAVCLRYLQRVGSSLLHCCAPHAAPHCCAPPLTSRQTPPAALLHRCHCLLHRAGRVNGGLSLKLACT